MTRDGAQGVRRRGGTKATQGINQDASTLARAEAAALSSIGAGPARPCPYQHHRKSYWRLAAGGPTVCGVCHTAAPGLEIVSVLA